MEKVNLETVLEMMKEQGCNVSEAETYFAGLIAARNKEKAPYCLAATESAI